MYSNTVTLDNKTIYIPSPPLYSKLGCLLFFTGNSNSGTTLHREDSFIDLVTVFDAILTSRQIREKLQCLYENLMSNNFGRTAVLKKI